MIEQHRHKSHNDRPDMHKREESTHNILKKATKNPNYKNNNNRTVYSTEIRYRNRLEAN